MKKTIQKTSRFPSLSKIVFFLRSWSAPGQCPMTVLIFFFRFFDFWTKMVAKRDPKQVTLSLGNGTKTLPKRSQNASATQPRFFIDFAWILGPIFIDFWWFWDPFWIVFFAASPFSPFPKYLPTKTDSPVSSQGWGGLRPALTMTFGIPFNIDFSIFFQNGESVK